MNSMIRIGGLNFVITELHSDEFENEDTFGQTNFMEQEICINKDLTQDMKMITLAHEMLHCLVEYSGLNSLLVDKDISPECICYGLENILKQFLDDNTNFFEVSEDKQVCKTVKKERIGFKP